MELHLDCEITEIVDAIRTGNRYIRLNDTYTLENLTINRKGQQPKFELELISDKDEKSEYKTSLLSRIRFALRFRKEIVETYRSKVDIMIVDKDIAFKAEIGVIKKVVDQLELTENNDTDETNETTEEDIDAQNEVAKQLSNDGVDNKGNEQNE